MRIRIGTKLIAGFALVVLLMTALALYSVSVSQQSLQESVGESSVFLAEEMLTRIDREIHLRIEQLQFYSENPLLENTVLSSNQEFEELANVQEYISQKDEEWVSAPRDEITPFMQEVLSNDLSNALRKDFVEFYEKKHGYRVFPEAYVTNKHGVVIASTGRTSDYLQADEEWYQKATAEEDHWVGEIEYDESSDAFASDIVINLYDENGSFAGIFKGLINTGRIIREAEILTKEHETTEVKLITKGGKLIYATKTFKFLEDISEKEVFEKIKEESGFFIAEEGGREKLISYAHLKGHEGFEGLQWILMVGHDVDDILKPAFVLRNNIAVASAVLIAMGIIIALFISRSITTPITKLTESTEIIGRGDLTHRIDVKVKDEIGDLAQAFNEMAASLRNSLGETAHGQRMMSALSQAAQAVLRARTPEEVYRAIGDEMTGLGYHALILTLTEDGEHMALSHHTFESPVLRAAEKLVGLSARDYRLAVRATGYHQQIISEGRTLFFEQMIEPMTQALPTLVHPLLGRVTAMLGMEQGIYAPLRVGDEPMGMIIVTGTDLAETDLPAVTAFASQTAIALENARAGEALERRVTELSALNSMATIVNESLEVDEILNRAMDETLRQVGVEAAGMLLLDEEVGELVMIAHRGISDEFVRAFSRMKLGEGLAGRVAQTGQPAIIGDLAEYPEARRAYVEKEHIQSAASVPLVGRTGAIGAMSLGAASPQYFDAGGLELLVALGQQIAIGVEKARLFSETRAQAQELMKHHDHLEELVEERAGELQRTNEELEAEVAERKRAEEALKQTLAKLEASQAAALNMMTDLETSRTAAVNMMADAEEARRMAEQANVGLKREIAERTRVEVELERSNIELEQFAYVASHDLQEPLRKVQVFGERLKAKQAHAFDDQGLDYLERMQDAAHRMRTMINDLLSFSRVATRGQPFVAVNLRRVARQAVSDLEVRIEQTGGEVEIGDLPTLEADPTQMRQLLVNLIGNSLKFHQEGAPPLVEITGKRIEGPEGELCQVLVKDNGIGFDEKYLDRLFTPFQRLHGRGKYPGTGIGLAICRKIAERHGGGITAQSAPGEGATFIVTLPVHQTEREDVKT